MDREVYANEWDARASDTATTRRLQAVDASMGDARDMSGDYTRRRSSSYSAYVHTYRQQDSLY